MPVVDDLTAFLEIFERAMDITWFPTESRLMNGRGVRNHPQLVFLNINPILVESALGPSYDVSHRSSVNGQDRRTQDYGQRVGTVGVSWIVQEDGELKSESQQFRPGTSLSRLTESSTSGCPMPRVFSLNAVNDPG